VHHILSVQGIEYIFAQVVDGILTRNTSKYKLQARSPDVRDRLGPSFEPIDLVRNWRSELDLLSPDIDADVGLPYGLHMRIRAN
jgi:hypothetical protein